MVALAGQTASQSTTPACLCLIKWHWRPMIAASQGLFLEAQPVWIFKHCSHPPGGSSRVHVINLASNPEHFLNRHCWTQQVWSAGASIQWEKVQSVHIKQLKNQKRSLPTPDKPHHRPQSMAVEQGASQHSTKSGGASPQTQWASRCQSSAPPRGTQVPFSGNFQTMFHTSLSAISLKIWLYLYPVKV